MQHIESPDRSDPGIERQIVAKGKTAPRVTPADIQDAIESVWYFTAYQGARHELQSDGVEATAGEERLLAPLKLLTFCVLVLRNGFTVTGESACASPENFDAEIGCNVARAAAEQKLWPLLGYELKSKLAEVNKA